MTHCLRLIRTSCDLSYAMTEASRLAVRRMPCILLCVLFISLSINASAQNEKSYSTQANIIYHFTRYIDWPPVKKTGDFVIGVTGDSPLFDSLRKNIGNKLAGNQRIVITRISPTSANFDCHILFLSGDDSRHIKEISSKTAKSPTLLVTAEMGLAARGSCINFAMDDERLRLEINKNNIQQRNLAIATELLQLGTIVN